MATIGELAGAASTRSWTVTGKTRLVKVYNRENAVAATRRYKTVMGYVTQEKYLYGLTAPEIEAALGLRPMELKGGAWVYSLTRLPTPGEVEFKLSTAFPDGRVFDDPTAAGADNLFLRHMAARKEFNRGRTRYLESYPPGKAHIPQWKITSPIPLGGLIQVATDVIPFSRQNGAYLKYRPHNRDV